MFAARLFCREGLGFHAESTVETELNPTVSLLCEIAKISSLSEKWTIKKPIAGKRVQSSKVISLQARPAGDGEVDGRQRKKRQKASEARLGQERELACVSSNASLCPLTSTSPKQVLGDFGLLLDRPSFGSFQLRGRLRQPPC